ncbi:MAG: SPOR domain-containing protein [Burkholderiales bacterium]|nr:SPOR domain-containing protein [Burkholderiales bacterium]
MKVAFLLLVLANLALYAWQQGVFGTRPDTGREPGRVAQQIAPERIRVLTPAEVEQRKAKAREQAAAKQASAVFSLAALDLAGGQACAEFGDFPVNEAARVRARLDAMELGDRLSTRGVELPGWIMVYLPPFKTRAEADRAAAELRKQGVRDFVVMGENTSMRNGIALASFKDPALAKSFLADIEKRGVKGVRTAERPPALPGTRFTIKALDAPTVEKLQALQKDFTNAKFAACASQP